MDNDTIFHASSCDETIAGKYRGVAYSQEREAIIILTNFRLLIRWKRTIYGCFTRSSYTSILLDSIDRIDDTLPNENVGIVLILLLLGGITSMIYGFVQGPTWLLGSSIAVNVVLVIILIASCFAHKNKCITLKGSFGSETILFRKIIATQFEQRVSEMIHQRRFQRFIEHSNHHEPNSLLHPSAPLLSRHNIEKNDACSPLTNAV